MRTAVCFSILDTANSLRSIRQKRELLYLQRLWKPMETDTARWLDS